MRTIIFTPSVPWAWMVQRPQQLANEFAKKGWRVFYQEQSARRCGGLPIPENLTVCNDNIQEIARMRAGGDHIDVVFSISPMMHRQKGWYGEKLFAYDCVDDFYWHWKENEDIMTENADVVVTTSDILYKKKVMQGNGNAVYLVRKGVNLDDFACDKPLDCPADMSEVRHSAKPVVGYTGAIAYWLDWDLIRYLQKSMPYVHFVYVGPPFGINLERDMTSHDNIRFLGVKASDMIPRYVKNFDVCIIPFLENDITASANPIKLYEYLALGSKVVSSHMPELEQYSSLIRMVNKYEDNTPGKAKKQESFKIAIDEAVAMEPQELKAERINVARQNSWSSRVDTLISIFEERLN